MRTKDVSIASGLSLCKFARIAFKFITAEIADEHWLLDTFGNALAFLATIYMLACPHTRAFCERLSANFANVTLTFLAAFL